MEKCPIEFDAKIKNGYESNNINKQLNKSKILIKRVYELKFENILYKIQIKIDSNFIYIKVFELIENIISPFYFRNKFDLQQIISILKLSKEQCDNLNKFMELFNDAYNNNNLKISLKEDELNINIIKKSPFTEINCPINLVKKKITDTEKFEIILNDIIILKNSQNYLLNNEKLLLIESLIKDIQIELKENKELIENLNFNIIENNSQIIKNEEEIKSLKDEISKIKNDLQLKYNSFLKNLNINTKINQKNIILKMHSQDIQKKNSYKLPEPIIKLSNKPKNILNENIINSKTEYNLVKLKKKEKMNEDKFNIKENNTVIFNNKINLMKDIDQDILRESANME